MKRILIRGLFLGAALAIGAPVVAQQPAASLAVTGAVSQPVGELDPDTTDRQFLPADNANGKPLLGENGAFRLVVPKDQRAARSIRMLTTLTVVQLRK